MPLLTINHKTVYRYSRPVAFGEHRIMLRPRDGHDLRVLSGSLEIEPQPIAALDPRRVRQQRCDRDLRRARRRAIVTSTVTVEHSPEEEFALTADDPGLFLSVPLRRRGIPGPAAVHHAAIWRSQRRTVRMGAEVHAERRPDADLQHPERHDAWHPRGLQLPQAPRAGHPASARHAADRSAPAATMRCS